MGGQSQDDKNSMSMLWAIAGIFLVGIIVWYLAGDQLKAAYFYVKYAELKLINLIVSNDIVANIILYINYFASKIANLLSVKGADFEALAPASDVDFYVTFMEKIAKPTYLTSKDAVDIGNIAGSYFRWPIVLLFIYLAVKSWHSNITLNYRKIYNTKSLLSQEKSIWPQISVVEKLDLVKADLDTGPWAMTTTPTQFCRHNKLIKVERVPNVGLQRGENYKVTLNTAKADAVFTKQLGKLYQGPDKMPIHMRALFSAFIARGCRDSKSGINLIKQMAISSGSPNINFEGVDELWKKHINNPVLQRLLQKHAYELTVMYAVLEFARQDGVSATSDFLWLKPMDRRLWYVLNSVGRQTPCVEAAGVYAHYLAEKSLERALTVPVINEATKGLQLALDEIIYQPTEQEREEILKRASKG